MVFWNIDSLSSITQMHWLSLSLFALSIFSVSGKENDTCSVRASSDKEDLFIVECTVNSQFNFADLQSIVESTQIHGDEDEANRISPQSIDELHVIGDFLELPPNAFAFLPNLRSLVIDSRSKNRTPNAIKLFENSLGGLSNLTSLSMITKFAPDSFSKESIFPKSINAIGSNLIRLSIEDANLSGVLTAEGLKTFPSLSELEISNSSSLKLSDDEKTFEIIAESLEKLILRGISMEKYPKSIKSLRGLKVLKLSESNLSELPPDAFANFASGLRELRISKNALTSLDANLFKNMKKLKILNLDQNKIDNLPENLFVDLRKLDELNLSGNELRSIPDFIFKNNTDLSKLDLSKNRLINITRSNVIGLDSLAHFDLSENRIRSFHVANLNAQLGVSLASNGIETLGIGFFESGSAFDRLILSSNPLKSIEIGAFSGVTIAENLFIQNANFTRLDLASFHGMKSKGAEGMAQIFISNCPELSVLTTSESSISWPSGIKQIVFTNDPKFVLADQNADGDRLAKFVRKYGTQFVFDGNGLCNCRWNWLRKGKYEKSENREQIVEFEFGEDQSAAMCCNFPNLSMSDFLKKEIFEKYCNETNPVAPETSVETCPQFDVGAMEEPEARKK